MCIAVPIGLVPGQTMKLEWKEACTCQTCIFGFLLLSYWTLECSLWMEICTGNSPRLSLSSATAWNCITGTSYPRLPSFFIWAAAGFSGSLSCRWLLWTYLASDHISQSNKSPLVITYIFYLLCSSGEAWVIQISFVVDNDSWGPFSI